MSHGLPKYWYKTACGGLHLDIERRGRVVMVGQTNDHARASCGLCSHSIAQAQSWFSDRMSSAALPRWAKLQSPPDRLWFFNRSAVQDGCSPAPKMRPSCHLQDLWLLGGVTATTMYYDYFYHYWYDKGSCNSHPTQCNGHHTLHNTVLVWPRHL